ncbi:hypothetical protein LRR81_17410 [Metabacillus sp. GX 13764]|uniref:hypothetical protein n=1 Tax=Metabacillus kandeliae TaxID=2900151 RepID=UPI001E2DD131|nr:hypothetical protein [Metabacillus kandeliae]MCD7036021.1 hypothetical protein [Metabacillus kandeliae]
MEFLIVVLIAVIFIIFAGVSKKKKQPGKNSLAAGNLPSRLGIKDGMNLEHIVDRLDAAWNQEYFQQVKARLIEKGEIHPAEYDWYELELKRFFILSALLKNVPMYNEKTDKIWHEMMLFTKSYSRFCEEFFGRFLHHEPETGEKPEEQKGFERGLFEFVYMQLFEAHINSENIYGKFLSNKLSSEQIRAIEEKSEAELLRDLFHPNVAEDSETARLTASKMKDDIKEARKINLHKSSDQPVQSRISSNSDDYLINNLLVFSIFHYMPENKDDGGSYFDPNSAINHHNHTHHHSGDSSGCSSSHHSCSGSSCSSGSSCGGSSCGSSS